MANAVEIAKCVLEGGVVLVPTDTNYALACMPDNEKACERLYKIKNRPPEKPLTLFVNKKDKADRFIQLTNVERTIYDDLTHLYWPGPLNIVLKTSDQSPKNRFFDSESISIVCNENRALNDLIEACDSPLALTSANISGTTVTGLVSQSMAKDLFSAKVDYILDTIEGTQETNQSSTIVRVHNDNISIVRQGDIIIDEEGIMRAE